MWALDFQFDSTWHGKTIKICNIIDEYTRENVAFTIDKKIDAGSVIELPDVACLEHGGRPRVIRMTTDPNPLLMRYRSGLGMMRRSKRSSRQASHGVTGLLSRSITG
ncbi:hypothetical protein [Trueperella pyogenes]|uniref:hypothetical protein n=1 Tax=Trueperella pyogenes TaxID=1661 RepID=UPI00345DEC67